MKEIVKVFAEEMEKILDEKFEKYQDSWKDEDLDSLVRYLNEQVRKLNKLLLKRIINKKDLRRLVHIANQCLILFTRLNK